ncbi:hypothetical protein EV207_10351 [Scopulibacillus darangshiensis]|uniref:Uncharacterized protein n=1 Tax=Scopulibacillus darangshiensis TaxID=442528 RepID=A0A4R2P9Y8_9BACL|nr:SA1362 family protein [Scopulibacillus darangshiensis]TCP31168.1 hypothetical protein EV207_10351 [Scopulibacillus darangshiensis]
MKSLLYYPIFFLIIGLGAIGLYSLVTSDPMSLVIKILIFGVIVGVGIMIFKRFINHRQDDSSAYRRAVKQSKKKHKSPGHKVRSLRATHLKVVKSTAKGKRGASPLKAKDHAHLTVIDGKKNKKKKRVLF